MSTLLLIILLLDSPLAFSSDSTIVGFRATLTHIDSGSPFTFTERFHRAVQRSHRRNQVLKHTKWPKGGADVHALVEWGAFEYLISFSIGTPPFPITAILDTGSDLIWTQCIPCFNCIPQLVPYFDPSNSSTFSLLPCSDPYCNAVESRCTLNLCQYWAMYGDFTVTQGFLAMETFAFGTGHSGTQITGLAFGCGMVNNGTLSNSTGIVGMARGPLSLPSQLRPKRFSYCLTPFGSASSSHLFLGDMADLNSLGGVVQSTPMVPNPSAYGSFYYLGLQGISLGHTILPVPGSAFELRNDGSGGVIIDSGTFLTLLNPTAYDAIKKDIVSAVPLPVANITEELRSIGVDLCFELMETALPEMPEMVFHFEGGDMVFPRDKYMLLEPESGFFCLMIASENDTSILGNYQQQDMHILYDLEANVLSFAPAYCDRL
ncbi:hypothetical protein Cni_G13827 [Canna indica]|uniref:Peptidase A1 domain-containing protein n=1 Tax=Canna indica TaxID=4628 RepID=A0AAQ3KBW5_9LILI|nr:hypothetical protein Cni_G13827 [Canna indica]